MENKKLAAARQRVVTFTLVCSLLVARLAKASKRRALHPAALANSFRDIGKVSSERRFAHPILLGVFLRGH